jgi:hypothetical protein
MLFEDAPAALDRVVLAVIRRVIEQLNRFSDRVGELHHPVQELSTLSVALRTVVGFDLQQRDALALAHRALLPPGLQGIDNEVAGLGGAAESQLELAGIFVDDPGREGRCCRKESMRPSPFTAGAGIRKTWSAGGLLLAQPARRRVPRTTPALLPVADRIIADLALSFGWVARGNL